MNQKILYAIANAGFLLILGIGWGTSSNTGVHPLYLALLFALCSSPLLNIRKLNDRYVLLVVFSLIYFLFYGALDLISLFDGTLSQTDGGFISSPELVILIGGAIAQIAYRISAQQSHGTSSEPVKDWSELTLVVFGCALWCIATWFTWRFKVYVLSDKNAITISRQLADLGGLRTMGLLLANMLQPLSILILAYAQCRFKRPYMFPLIIGVVLVQLAIGFITDVKGDALIGAVLIIATRLLVDGRVSKSWIIAMVAFLAVAFPAMQANRTLRNQYRLDSIEVAQHAWDIAKQAFARGEQATGNTRAPSIFERMSLKGSVEMIVTRTGADVPFQYGYTLTPIWAAFIPKIIWPTKPDVQTGQLVNKEFSVTNAAYASTYISPSHLGELYWNFSWPGVIAGMSLIGLLLGHIGRKIDMTSGVSVTKLMIAAITLRELILGFESSIAAPYVVWMRSLAAIGLLHLLLAKSSKDTLPANDTHAVQPKLPAQVSSQPSFENLMR